MLYITFQSYGIHNDDPEKNLNISVSEAMTQINQVIFWVIIERKISFVLYCLH